MAGSRGPLKLANHLHAVPDATKGSAAADVQALAPLKPAAVAQNEELSKLWDDIVPQLDRAGLVAVSDGPSIELALRHFLMARQASDNIGGDVVVDDKAHSGVKKNPAEAVFRAQSEMFLKYAQQLGMTFVSRARTPSAKGDAGGDQNPFAPTQTGS